MQSSISPAPRAALAATGTGTVSGPEAIVYAYALTLVFDYVIMIETAP